ncbi:preprotein translocase subunit SecA [Stieleria neptunia]|uniref:Preprotein translocase subunit SecA n=1 Tax=Stieleria neptunia TaxID=2527979 RepID=A0A518HJM3_9BACT|nr:SEC-C metal-binding domain-containing protein [Stieleria neptunia]QDV41055.1 preprotein translocase subunit SecA [Stieleria neptunia]
MGAMADAMAAYAQPLIDETDGSPEQMQMALNVAMACWNIGKLPEDKRQSAINSFADSMGLDEAECEAFQDDVLMPMISRHDEMFGQVFQSNAPGRSDWESGLEAKPPKAQAPKPGRYDPCPCNSGKKYKFCCERAARAR